MIPIQSLEHDTMLIINPKKFGSEIQQMGKLGMYPFIDDVTLV